MLLMTEALTMWTRASGKVSVSAQKRRIEPNSFIHQGVFAASLIERIFHSPLRESNHHLKFLIKIRCEMYTRPRLILRLAGASHLCLCLAVLWNTISLRGISYQDALSCSRAMLLETVMMWITNMRPGKVASKTKNKKRHWSDYCKLIE